MTEKGFFPCFSQYSYKNYPINTEFYANTVYINKLKNLVSSLITSKSALDLKNSGIGKEIKAIRPGDNESNRIIKLFSTEGQLYRIDYGNTPFRIIFSLQENPRHAHILAIDLNHKTYSGKIKR